MAHITEIIWSVLGIAGVAVMYGTSVHPKQAVSHAAEWAKALGWKNPPQWLKSENSDRVIRHIGLMLVVACGLYWTYQPLENMMPTGAKILFVVGAVGVFCAIGWSLIVPQKSESNGPQVHSPVTTPAPPPTVPAPDQRPTIDIADSVRPTVRDNTVVGEPKGVFRARNTVDLNMEGNFFIDRSVPPPPLPNPTGEFTLWSVADLKKKAAEVSQHLRALQDTAMDDTSRNAILMDTFLPVATSITSEVIKRVGPIDVSTPQDPLWYERLSRVMRGSDLIHYKHPLHDSAGCLADFLDLVAERLR